MSIVVGILIAVVALGARPSRFVGRNVPLSRISQRQRTLKLGLVTVELGAAVAGVFLAFGAAARGAAVAGVVVVAVVLALFLGVSLYVAATRIFRPRRYQFVRALRHAVVIHGFQSAPGMEAVISHRLWHEWKDRTDGVSAADYIEARWDEIAGSVRGATPPSSSMEKEATE